MAKKDKQEKKTEAVVVPSGDGGGLGLNDLNNVIVKMRPAINRARIHIINHLTRQNKKLTARKVKTDKEREKNARKAARMTAEVMFLKGLDRGEFGKFALKNTKTLDDVMKRTMDDAEMR